MGTIQLPELVDRILQDLDAVGIHPSLEHRYTPEARLCTIPDPDRIAKVFSVFLLQLESALQGTPCSLRWDYQEGVLVANLVGNLPQDLNSLLARSRTSLQCLGGTLTFEPESCSLILPLGIVPPPTLDTPVQCNTVLARQNPVFDPAVLQQACPDEEFSQQLIEEFLSRCKLLLQELEHLVLQGKNRGEDLAKIHRIAHSMKGGGWNVGALRLAEVARWMEQQARSGRIENLQETLNHLKEEERLLESTYREHYGRKANPSGRG
jgi:HPt (histidine-containing phosphotransfer) domain-containing protein